MKKLSILSLLLLTFLAYSCKKDSTEDPQDTAIIITPGVGITNLKIGDPAQKAIDLYGSVTASYGASGGTYTHFLTYFSKGVIVYCEPTTEAQFNAQMKIDNLTLSAPFDGKTDKQIGIGSTKTEVKAAYGDPIFPSQFFGDEYAGITFKYEDNTDKVESIEIE